MKQLQTNHVVQGAVLLTIAGLFSKVLSATYRIPLQNLTGDLGFYIYQQIYPFIGIMMILSLYGFPAAISRLTVERRTKHLPLTYKQFYIPVFMLLFLFNGLLCVLLVFLAPHLASWVGDEQLTSTFTLAAFLFLFIPFLALLRGVSQGHEQMHPTAYSQMLEQLVRVIIIIGAAYFVATGTLQLYEIGIFAVIATMVGMVVAIMMLLFMYRPKREEEVEHHEFIPWRSYMYIIFSLGFVASLNHIILLLLQFVDVFTLVPSLVTYPFTLEEAMQLKGIFDRGQPLIQFGVVFGSSFALALIPSVMTRQMHEEETHLTYVREAILFSFYIAAGATIGLVMLMGEVNILLFTNDAGTYSLRILVLSILLTAMTITMIAILQNLGQMRRTALYIMGAIFVKVLLNIWLVPILSITGSALATVGSLLFLLITVSRLFKKTLPNLQLFSFVKWRGFFMAALSMTVYIMLSKWLVQSMSFTRIGLSLYVLFVVVTGALLYMACLIRYDVLSKHQYEALPFSRFFLQLEEVVRKKK